MKKKISRANTLKVSALYRKSFSESITMLMMRIFFMLILSTMLIGLVNAQKSIENTLVNLNEEGVILDGYDAVAFFTDNMPVKGDVKFKFTYESAIYYFASQEHLDLFRSTPEKYKPQFGGYCAYAVSLGHVAPIDVNTFSIVDGRLVLQHNQRAVNGWNKDVSGNLQLADKYWPAVVKNNGKQITTDAEKKFLNNVDPAGVTLQGYDPVAYFTNNKAVMGDPKYSARYNGATYWFSSEEHTNLFKDNPTKYAPQYGSFCGYALSLNKLRPVDPTIFQITNNRLILQHTKDAYDLFNKDLDANISKADNNWPGQVKKHAGKKVKFDKPAQPATNTATN